MMQNSYDAAYGHTMGGIINTVMKSGGSRFHGSAWEFHAPGGAGRQYVPGQCCGAPKPTHYLDDYGGEVDGQVIVPKLLRRNGYIKLFYMGRVPSFARAHLTRCSSVGLSRRCAMGISANW